MSYTKTTIKTFQDIEEDNNRQIAFCFEPYNKLKDTKIRDTYNNFPKLYEHDF